MRKILTIFLCLFILTGCTDLPVSTWTEQTTESQAESDIVTYLYENGVIDETDVEQFEQSVESHHNATTEIVYTGYEIPDYSGTDIITLNNNVPVFNTVSESSYEYYSDLDSLGRCGVCEACIGQDIMPTEPREEIGSVTPSGWVQAKYDMAVTQSDSPYLYNRCHLIGFQLAGENANEKNLITGTRHFNVDLMLIYEDIVADYVKNTGNHVMYRVTPVYNDGDLVAKGVQMEGYSVEDNGLGVCFNVFCYNVQPGVSIDYSTGASTGPEFTGTETSVVWQTVPEPAAEETSYVLNTNSMKFHLPDCASVSQMAEHNRQDVSWTRDECIANGYSPCGVCHP